MVPWHSLSLVMLIGSVKVTRHILVVKKTQKNKKKQCTETKLGKTLPFCEGLESKPLILWIKRIKLCPSGWLASHRVFPGSYPRYCERGTGLHEESMGLGRCVHTAALHQRSPGMLARFELRLSLTEKLKNSNGKPSQQKLQIFDLYNFSATNNLHFQCNLQLIASLLVTGLLLFHICSLIPITTGFATQALSHPKPVLVPLFMLLSSLLSASDSFLPPCLYYMFFLVVLIKGFFLQPSFLYSQNPVLAGRTDSKKRYRWCSAVESHRLWWL